SFIKKDSLSNYDFLFRKKDIDTTQQTKGKMNLAEVANKLINSVLYKIPENMELKKFEVSYQDDSTRQHINIPQAIIAQGDLTSTLILNRKEAVWHAEGQLNPSKKQ